MAEGEASGRRRSEWQKWKRVAKVERVAEGEASGKSGSEWNRGIEEWLSGYRLDTVACTNKQSTLFAVRGTSDQANKKKTSSCFEERS